MAKTGEVREALDRLRHPSLYTPHERHQAADAIESNIAALSAEVGRLQARLGKAEANERRYLFLRNDCGDDLAAPFVCGVHGAPMGDAGWLTGDDLDKACETAIDAITGRKENV